MSASWLVSARLALPAKMPAVAVPYAAFSKWRRARATESGR